MTTIEVPSPAQISEVRAAGTAIGYSGAGIYVRYRTILGVLAGLRANRVLIMGCGHGMFDRLLPESSQVVGFDIGEDEIRTASAWAVENRPSSRYVLGGVDEIPVEDGWADLTIASEVIEHLSEEEVGPFLGAARRLTKPDGRVVVTVPNVRQLRNRARQLVGRPPVFMDPDHDREYTLETAREAIESSGLTIEEVRGAVLYGPFERVAQKVIPADSPLRTGAADRWPRVASHLIFVCRP